MPKAPPQQSENEIHVDGGDRPSIGSLVRSSVIAALGRPPGLFDVSVRTLWDNQFRVNVLVGPDITAIRIAHSFFVKAGPSGEILSAMPQIIKQYA